jgi:hypothetical protein
LAGALKVLTAPGVWTTIGGGSFATDAETIAGTEASKAVTPAGLKASHPYIDVRSYGAVGNGTPDDTAAIQAALNAAELLLQHDGAFYPDRSPEVHLAPSTYYQITSLIVPQGVRLMGRGSELRGTVAGKMVVLDGPGASVEDVYFDGQPNGVATIGVHVPYESPKYNIRCTVRRCVFNGFKGSAILLDGNGAWITDCFAQNCVLDADALVAPTGALHLSATANDTWVTNSEFTTSRTTMSASGKAYAVVVLSKGITMHGVIGEISDHGFYINGVHNKFTGCRADLNRGHGFVFDGGDGVVSACNAISDGREATNTYDGFNVNAGAYKFSSCDANVLSTLTSIKHRYGFNAIPTVTVGSVFDASCWSDNHATAAVKVPTTGGRVIPTQGPFINITAGATTWDVQTFRWPHCCWNLLNSGPVSLTALTNGVPGQRVILRGDGFTTLVHNGGFITDTLRMIGGANILTAAHTFYEFVCVGQTWIQVAASVPFATNAETLTGTATDKAVTPAGLASVLAAQAINAQVGTTYTLALTDNNKLVTLTNAAAITLSVPTNAVVAFPIGTRIDLAQLGAGKVTVAAVTPGTTTVNATPSLALRAQYSAASLVKTATDAWLLVGDLL